jgi:hypothetical protein
MLASDLASSTWTIITNLATMRNQLHLLTAIRGIVIIASPTGRCPQTIPLRYLQSHHHICASPTLSSHPTFIPIATGLPEYHSHVTNSSSNTLLQATVMLNRPKSSAVNISEVIDGASWMFWTQIIVISSLFVRPFFITWR